MKTYILHLWDTVRASYWFVPSLCSIGALIFSFVMPLLDDFVLQSGWELPKWIQTTTETARATLSAMAGAMIAVTGTVFSITIVTLSLTSQQFGPRLLRRFIYDLTTQITLGVFLSTGFYCLLLLRAVEKVEGGNVAPNFSVLLAVVLSVFSMVMLIVFIHHIAMLIQAPNVVAAVANDLDSAILRLFPEGLGKSAEEQDRDGYAQEEQLGNSSFEIRSTSEGYIQAVAADSLLNWAQENDAVVRLLVRPGDFLTQDSPLAEVWIAHPEESKPPTSEEATEAINGDVIVGVRRTPRQDVECAVEELVEVAVRSLSPGINDPFTAMTCIDRLGASLGRLAKRKPTSAYRCDHDGKLRVIARPVRFADVLDAAFNQIRQFSNDSVAVTIRLLESLRSIARRVDSDEDLAAVKRHAEMTVRLANAFREESDQKAVKERFQDLLNGG